MRLLTSSVVLAAFALYGCAAPKPAEAPQLGKSEAVECHREQPPGLLRTVTVCRKVEDAKLRTKESKEFVEDMKQPPAAIR